MKDREQKLQSKKDQPEECHHQQKENQDKQRIGFEDVYDRSQKKPYINDKMHICAFIFAPTILDSP
jgi:hypothetical protein